MQRTGTTMWQAWMVLQNMSYVCTEKMHSVGWNHRCRFLLLYILEGSLLLVGLCCVQHMHAYCITVLYTRGIYFFRRAHHQHQEDVGKACACGSCHRGHWEPCWGVRHLCSSLRPASCAQVRFCYWSYPHCWTLHTWHLHQPDPGECWDVPHSFTAPTAVVENMVFLGWQVEMLPGEMNSCCSVNLFMGDGRCVWKIWIKSKMLTPNLNTVVVCVWNVVIVNRTDNHHPPSRWIFRFLSAILAWKKLEVVGGEPGLKSSHTSIMILFHF